jgi:hypothetical protein
MESGGQSSGDPIGKALRRREKARRIPNAAEPIAAPDTTA